MSPKDIILLNTSLYEMSNVLAVASTHVATNAKILFVLSNSITFLLIVVRLNSKKVPIVYRSFLRREVDAETYYLAAIGHIWFGIAFVLYLRQSGRRTAVELKLEDIHVIRTFKHAVNPALARLLLHQCIVSTEHLHDEIERVLKIALTLKRVLLALETIGDRG